MIDYALMNQLLFEGKHEVVKQMTEAALAEGRLPMEVLEDGLIAGMRVVGEDFRHNRIFVPEVLLAARAMKAGMAILRPLLIERNEESKNSAVIVMGTVKGDLHDIGKNLVGMMSEGAGFTIVDLGTDTSADRFVEAARQHNASIVGLSALLDDHHGVHAHGRAEVQGARHAAGEDLHRWRARVAGLCQSDRCRRVRRGCCQCGRALQAPARPVVTSSTG